MATRRYKAMTEAEKKKVANDAVMDYMTGTEGVDATAKRYPVTGASISAWVHDFCLRKNPDLYQRLKCKDDFTVRCLRENAGGFLYPVKIGRPADNTQACNAFVDNDKYQILTKKIEKLEVEIIRLKTKMFEQDVVSIKQPKIKKENWLKRLVYAI